MYYTIGYRSEETMTMKTANNIFQTTDQISRIPQSNLIIQRNEKLLYSIVVIQNENLWNIINCPQPAWRCKITKKEKIERKKIYFY